MGSDHSACFTDLASRSVDPNMSDQELVESIFLQAVSLPKQDRSEFLTRQCGDDSGLRAAVEQLIAADEQAGQSSFLKNDFIGNDFAGGASPDSEAGRHRGPGGAASAIEAGESHDGTDDVHGSARFRILGSHREGGLGEVLLAHDRQLDRDVAVKQIRTRYQSSVEARERFIKEAKVTGRLEHPGIVPVYAMGVWPDGSHYYAMRFIEGQTMKDAIDSYHRSREPMQLRELLSRFIDVCNTIEYAHSKKVLHRDIKPSNIMVGPYGETLVVDWGLAKLLDESSDDSMTADLAKAFGSGSGSTPTQVGGTIGTPYYMSPEQASGNLDQIGCRTDVYLLGATLYEILTGTPPHRTLPEKTPPEKTPPGRGDSIETLLRQIRQGVLQRPRERVSDVPPALESVCLKAMASDPVDRYCDPKQIAEDVNRWMADQSVSVHRDPISVHAARWIRQHRAATSTIAVAVMLLAVGGVLGAILWNRVRLKEFQAEQESLSKQLELQIKDRERLAGLTGVAEASLELAEQEIASDRFSSALQVLRNAALSLEPEAELRELAETITAKADRVTAIVDFYQLSDIVEQQNVLSRDTKALAACTSALQRLGIWEHPDWWTALPDEDLSPHQIDRLRWDVYQQLMLMDAMLIKTIGVRLAGDGRVGGAWAALRVGVRMATTDAGKPEALAALAVSDRLDRFRVSESARLYRSLAQARLNQGDRLLGTSLDLPANAADSHSLAVLSMIAALDPSFKIVFSDYLGDDALAASRELFARSASLRPAYYGAHLGLGQVEYLLSGRRTEQRWEDLDPALRAFSQCITLRPDRCFAFADRSSIYRKQAERIRNDDRYDQTEKTRRVSERLRWSLQDGLHALEQFDEHPWVGWQAGQCYAALGQVDRATEMWIRTAIATLPLGQIADATVVQVDDLRGRAEIGDWLDAHLTSPADPAISDTATGYVALAGLRLNQTRLDDATVAVDRGLAMRPEHVDGRAIRGMILLQRNRYDAAEDDFGFVLEKDPRHPLAWFGRGRCCEHSGEYSNAVDAYDHAREFSVSAENRAAAELGRCRCCVLSGDTAEGERAVRVALDIEPACDLLSVARPLATALVAAKKRGDPARQQTLSKFLRLLAELPRATQVQTMPAADPAAASQASLLNGDFELGSMRYWTAPSGTGWQRETRASSSAVVTDQQFHSGRYGLRIDVESNAAADEGVIGQTGQEFSLLNGVPYRVECWVKADSVQPDAMKLIGPDGSDLLEFQSGTYDWRRVTGTLTHLEADQPRGAPIRCRIEIVARRGGTLWIDDLRCDAVLN